MQTYSEPWLIIEIKKSSFARLEDLESYLKSLFSMVDPWISRDRRMVLIDGEEGRFFQPLQRRFEPPCIFAQPEGWGNAVALFLMLLEIERKEREAQVIYLPASPFCRGAMLGGILRHGHRVSLESRQSILLMGYREPGKRKSSSDWILTRGATGSIREVFSLLRSEDPEFTGYLFRQGAFRDSGIACGNVGIFLLLYMLAQAELVLPLLRYQRREDKRPFLAEVSEAASRTSLFRDIFRENLPFLRCLRIPPPGFTGARTQPLPALKRLDPLLGLAKPGLENLPLH